VRCLIIGCGCRGRLLARALVAQGHAVRGTSRRPDRLADIHSCGAEPVVGDPDRVATLIEALDHVSVVCILLGSATGTADQLRALHGTRLEMLLTKLIDTTARGVIYEARGTIDPGVLAAGAQLVSAFGERTLARTVVLEADPGELDRWLVAALAAVDRVAGAAAQLRPAR
jgi:threonine dehydrogenase-like Zn-dependent dehydrogenase